MSDDKNGVSEGGLFTTLLLVSFIVLKLCKVVDWSWWWVLSPFWIPIALAIPFVILAIRRDRKIRNRYNSDKPISKWQQRVREMQEKQKANHN